MAVPLNLNVLARILVVSEVSKKPAQDVSGRARVGYTQDDNERADKAGRTDKDRIPHG